MFTVQQRIKAPADTEDTLPANASLGDISMPACGSGGAGPPSSSVA